MSARWFPALGGVLIGANLGGLDWRLFLGLLLLLPIGLSAILVAAPYRLQRLVA